MAKMYKQLSWRDEIPSPRMDARRHDEQNYPYHQREITPDYDTDLQYYQSQQGHDPYTSQSQGYNTRHQQSYQEGYNNNNIDMNNVRENRIADPSDVHPTYHYSSKSPKGTLIRHRMKSRKRGETWDEPDYDDDDEILPSQREQKRSRTKSFKERKDELQEMKEKDYQKPPTLTERLSNLKQGNDMNTRNLADIVRESTLTRMNNFGLDSKAFTNVQRGWKSFSDRFTIWSGTLKEVEGKYGTAVMTYFRFIKWLMFLNLYIMVIMFCIISVPHLVLGPKNFNESLPNPNVTGYSEAIWCTSEYETYHKAVRDNETIALVVLDFVQGTGWMERTVMFYGAYYNKTYYNVISKEQTTYDMGLCYLVAVFICFVLSSILVVKNTGKNFKVTMSTDEGYAKYCNKVFAGWDYCIVAEKNVKIKHRTLKIDIESDLREQQKMWKDADMELSDRAKLYAKRIFINIVVLCLLGGALAVIVVVAEEMLKIQQRELEAILEFLVQYVPFLTITVLNLILPVVFQKIVQFEDYTFSFQIKITLFRSILLRLASPIALLGILYRQLLESVSQEDTGDKLICGNKQWDQSSGRGSIMCWEVFVGQQLYKLVLLDFFIETGIIFFVQAPRSFLYKRYSTTSKLINIVGPQEFDLPQSVVDIVYTQILCWLGLFFSPLIPFMTFLKCFLFFWVKKFAAIVVSVPQGRPLKTSRSNSLFMLVLLLALIIAIGLVGVMVASFTPSQSCGPFRVYNSTSDAVMFDSVTNFVDSWPSEIQTIIKFLTSYLFLAIGIVFLGLVMYIHWLFGQGYKKRQKILQNQLKLEGKDKKYLLARVNEVLENQQINKSNVEMLAST